MASQFADYEITSSTLEDGTLPCLRARRPARLGGDGAPATIWIRPPGPDALGHGQVEAGTNSLRSGRQPPPVARSRRRRVGTATGHLG